MELIFHQENGDRIAEIVSGEVMIHTVQDMLDFIAAAFQGGADSVILHEKQIHPDFFRLKTGLAGEILQKVVNYAMRIAIIGDFHGLESKSLRQFIHESNRGNQVFFVPDLAAAKSRLFSKSSHCR
jgi:hypothetical protein